MIPSIYDICEKDVLTINIHQTLKEAIKAIASTQKRTIVVVDNRFENTKYAILSAFELIEFKINKTDLRTTLDTLVLDYTNSLPHDLSILSVLNHIASNDQYMIICKENKLVGIISYTDIINNIDPNYLIEKQTISSIIFNYRAVFVYEDSSTLQAINLIRENQTDSIIVKDNEHNALGIFTTKDFIKLMYEDSDLSNPIKKYMTTPLQTLDDNSSISQALDFIKEKHFKRIVVVDDKNKVSGIITQKELLKISYTKWMELIRRESELVKKENYALLQTKNALENEISLDYLTKLSNRLTFDKQLQNKISNIKKQENESFSIILIDIDDFKSINDTFGHLEGDSVLQEVSKALTYLCNKNDLLARWGGEKFIIVLSNTSIESTLVVAQTIRKTIENYVFRIRVNITCSIGVSSYHENDNKDSVTSRAELALRRVKEQGKNKVELETFN